jgi:hypothetical protein
VKREDAFAAAFLRLSIKSPASDEFSQSGDIEKILRLRADYPTRKRGLGAPLSHYPPRNCPGLLLCFQPEKPPRSARTPLQRLFSCDFDPKIFLIAVKIV